MTLLTRLKFLFRNLFRSRAAERALDAELQSSVELLAADYEARGLGPDAARRAARIELGGTTQVAEHVRSVRLGYGLSTFWSDLRYGWRGLRRSPGFSVVAIGTLALGLGASISTFSIVYSVLWRELPYPNAERLVAIEADVRGRQNLGPASSEIKDIVSRSRSLSSVSTLNGVDAFLNIDGELHHVPAASATDEVLPLLGVRTMALGRPLSSRDDIGGQSVTGIVISHRLWRDHLGSDPRAAGRRIRVNDLDVQIAGVLGPELRTYLPASMNLAEHVDVWFPRGFEDGRADHQSPALALLQPGATIEQAQQELDAIARESVRDYPTAYANGGLRLWARPLRDVVGRGVKPALISLTFAVAFVLLIAWINTANLLVARSQARARELSVRRALGASRTRVVRQLLTECALLASIASGLGFVLAQTGLRVFHAFLPNQLPRQAAIALDGTVVMVAIALTVLTTLALGILPALPSGRSDWTPLRAGRGEAGTPRRALQRGLLISEVALTVVSLVAAGLMLRTFVNLTHAPVGFDTTDIMVANAPMSSRMTVPRRYSFYKDAIERVRALPGVAAVSAGGPLPFALLPSVPRYFRADDPTDPGSMALLQSVFPDYFRVMGIRLLSGREFSDADIVDGRLVAVIDERIARELFQGDAIGKQIRLRSQRTTPVEIVGVTTAVRMTRVRDDRTPVVFVPFHYWAIPMSLVIKTPQGQAIASPVRNAVESLGSGRAVHGVQPLAGIAARSIDDTRVATSVLGVFGALTLILAAIGLYGTLTYLISRRTREFGVRIAMGATQFALVRLVSREGLVLVAIGVVLGLAGTVGVGRLLREMLYEVSPIDLATSVAVSSLVVVTAIAAVSYPAWRASRTDPNVALRSE